MVAVMTDRRRSEVAERVLLFFFFFFFLVCSFGVGFGRVKGEEEEEDREERENGEVAMI